MAIKKFILSDGAGDLEESSIDSSGSQTISYDDSIERIIVSNQYISGNLFISGSTFAKNISGSFIGNGSGLTNIPNSSLQNSYININGTNVNLGGSIVIAGGSGGSGSGNAGVSSWVSGALYIANNNQQLTPFTGNNFNLIAWDALNNRWQSYNQPYDIAVDIYGSVTSGTSLLRLKLPKNLLFNGYSSNQTQFSFFLNGIQKTTFPFSGSAGETLSVIATDDLEDPYLTITAVLR
jgi:hypothetical protein